ncbi:helix-turn-helix domain-containing protein [Actinomadura luteofluorescens]|uniref:helix-turn-helix domain-containing protein n=1 Tax=Actinomadura luteofluorescens TaxID=46163 RepID=UPI003470F4AF
MPHWAPLRGDDPEVHALVEALREMLDRCGRSLRELATLMPYGRSTISDRLNGQTRPDWEFVVDLCKACHNPDRQGVDRHLAYLRDLWKAADPVRERSATEHEDGGAEGGDGRLVRVLHEAINELQQRMTAEDDEPAASAPGRPAAGILGPAPQRNAHFAGRTDLLAELRRRFSAPSTQVLYGMVGVGKTQLAAEYAYRYRSLYRMIWWVPAEDPGWLRATLAALAPHVGLQQASSLLIEDAFRAVLTELDAGPRPGRRLLIFDDAGSPASISPLIPRAHADVLITSRDPAWRTDVADALLVGTFSRRESTAFLRELAGPEFGTADAQRLAEAVGDLPLALQEMAAFRDRTGVGVDDLIRNLSACPSRVLSESDPIGGHLPLTADWSLSAIWLEASCPDALDLLRFCATAGTGRLSWSDLTAAGEGAGEKTSALLSDWYRLVRAVQELGRAGLAQVDPASQTIRVHPLIAALVMDEHSS